MFQYVKTALNRQPMPLKPMTPPHDPIRETLLPLGRDRSLVAIASQPQIHLGRPAVVLVNAGVIHRVGPHRLHVRLARRLATAGQLAIRMDLSGIGDSGPLPEQLGFRASSVADISTAADHLTTGASTASIIVFGICSGADNALAAAEADPRIVGLVLVDPPCYATSGSRRRALRARLRDPRAWRGLPARLLGRWRKRPAADAHAQSQAANAGRQPPAQDVYGRQLQALVDRGVRILSVYTSAQGMRYNHRDQFFEWFPALRDRLDVHYLADANHTLTELSKQAAFIDLVVDWCDRRFAATP
jgi:pimeloyl-ACP methyl ester carboxylesterase